MKYFNKLEKRFERMSDKMFSVKLLHKGQHVMMSNIKIETTLEEIQTFVETEFGLEKDCMKLLHKGKKLENNETSIIALSNNKIVKVMVMAPNRTDCDSYKPVWNAVATALM